MKDRCIQILDDCLEGLQSSSTILKLALSMSSSEITDSRLGQTLISPVLDQLNELRTLVNELNNLNGENHISEEESDNITRIQDSEQRIIQTRSKGPASCLPNVQPLSLIHI